MLIIGASGHTKEIFDVYRSEYGDDSLSFFDNINDNESFYGFPIVKSFEQMIQLFKENNKFISGLGGTGIKKDLINHIIKLGGSFRVNYLR